MKKIIAGVTEAEGSMVAARIARDISRAVGASLVLAHVSRPVSRSVRDERMRREFAEAERRYVDDLLNDVKEDLAVQCETLKLTGHPAEEFVRLSSKPDVKLLVFGMKPRRGVSAVVPSGFANGVSRRAYCDTLLVHHVEGLAPLPWCRPKKRRART